VAIKRYGGGATIGEFSSAQDMEVIDLGVLLLSMHYRFMLTFYRS
jgi:aspartyl aminopeptidase